MGGVRGVEGCEGCEGCKGCRGVVIFYAGQGTHVRVEGGERVCLERKSIGGFDES